MSGMGLAWTIISMEVIIRWMASPTEFQPAPHANGVRIPVWRLVMLRIVEVVSTIMLAGFLYCCVAKPLYPRREFTLDAKFVVIGLIALVSDGFLNGQQYIFAWNSYMVNRAGALHGVAALGPPMCVSFCAGVAIVGCQQFRSLRRRWPRLSNVALFTIIWVDAFIFDFCVEKVVISTTHACAFAKTYKPLTIMAGATN